MTSETFLMDCMDYMAALPDKAFELAIVDPPYGITADSFNTGLEGGLHSEDEGEVLAGGRTIGSKGAFRGGRHPRTGKTRSSVSTPRGTGSLRRGPTSRSFSG